jgi:hypothetical protein
MALLLTKNSGRKVKYERFGDYKIILEKIDRDWSEDAWQYEVEGTAIKDECEGYDEAVRYAKIEIDAMKK